MNSRLFMAFGLAILLSPSSITQTFRGGIAGNVTDASGAAIAGAEVQAVNIATQLRRETITTSTGTHPVSFRISENSYQDFLALMESVPGSEAGAMYREIFARGLKSLQAFYATHADHDEEGARP